MQQIHRKTSMSKCQSNFIEYTLRHGCSPVNLRHIFRRPFPKNTSWWLLLILLDFFTFFVRDCGILFCYRSSRLKVFCEKGVLRNFAKFIGKHLRQSIFLIKLQASGKKETQVFSSEFCEIFKNTFSYSVPPVAASVNLMIYSPKTLQCTIKLPFSGWECSFILLRPGWLYTLQKKSKSLKR